MRKLLTSAAVALGLTLVPVAQAAAPSRASAPVTGESGLFGEGEPGAPLIMALVIAAATIFLLVDLDDDDEPDSP